MSGTDAASGNLLPDNDLRRLRAGGAKRRKSFRANDLGKVKTFALET